MKFYSPYINPRSSLPEPECSKFIKDYILDEASQELIESGSTNFYERIQSYHESSKLSCKLARFGLGDTYALGVPRDCDIDLSGIPGDLREVLDSRSHIQEQFNAFPAELRKLFSDSFSIFEKSVSEGTADSILRDFLGKLSAGTGSGTGRTVVTDDTSKSS